MKRILVLLTAAAMMASMMAMSGVAQAKPIGDSADAQCAKLAIQTLGPSYNPSNYTFIGGTEGNDNFTLDATDGPYVFCGFGGDDVVRVGFPLGEDDIFLGGAGNDSVASNSGTFYGGAGNDDVTFNYGTFYGEEGEDYISDNLGTFYGGADRDRVDYNLGTFYGGAGDDRVFQNWIAFYGEEGDDMVDENYGEAIE